MLRRIATVHNMYLAQFIRQNIDFYGDRLILLLNKTSELFDKNKYLEVNHFTYLFKFIGGLACANPYPDYEVINSQDAILTVPINPRENLEFTAFLYPNDDGLFGFNTYLRAYFSLILLVGVPNRAQSYDNLRGCPIAFMEHDYAHNYNIITTKQEEYIDYFHELQDVYVKVFKVIEDKMTKEMILLSMWILIHEFFDLSSLDAYSYVEEVLQSAQPFIDEFESIFQSYAPILDEPENFESIMRIIEDNGMINEYEENLMRKPFRKYYYLTMIYSYIQMISLM